MDYSLTQEQQLIQESVFRMLEQDYDFHKRCKWLSKGQRFQQSIWNQFAQLGLCALPFSVDYGGLNASAVDVSLLADSFGEFLVVEPFLPTYLSSCFLLSCASKAQKDRFIPDVCSGKSRIVMALDLFCSQDFLLDYQLISCVQTAKDQWSLSGSVPMVYGLESADFVICFARNEKKRILPFLVSVDDIQMKNFSLIDDQSVSQLFLKDVKVSKDCLLRYKKDILLDLYVKAVAFLSAEAVSIMKVLNEKTKQYLKDREQFGKPLSKFQVLQHRLVEMYVQEEQARSMSLALNFALSSQERSLDLLRFSHMVKLKINDYSQYIGEQSVQLHGGMGVSDELDVAHYFRRLTCIRHQFGDQLSCLSNLVDFL